MNLRTISEKKEFLSQVSDLYTHSGKFHADDVFAFAALRMMGVSATAVLHRVSKLPDYMSQTDLAFDIGGGPFDHHSKATREIRPSGIPYASFGLIMREFYPMLGLNVYEYQSLDRNFISELDRSDTQYCKHGNQLSGVIASFNPDWDGDNSLAGQMEAFMYAAAVAEVILGQQIQQVKARSRAHTLVADLEETAEYHCVFLDHWAPVIGSFTNHKDIFWMCYADRDEWTIKSVRGPNRKPKAIMPKKFRECVSDNLPKGMTFINPNGTDARFDSLQSARLFAKRYLSIPKFPSDDDLSQDTEETDDTAAE